MPNIRCESRKMVNVASRKRADSNTNYSSGIGKFERWPACVAVREQGAGVPQLWATCYFERGLNGVAWSRGSAMDASASATNAGGKSGF